MQSARKYAQDNLRLVLIFLLIGCKPSMLIPVGIAHIASGFEVIKELSIYKTQAKILTIIPDVGFELVFN